ncbi:MAG: ABC transporter permease DevC [Microcoleaceae cyanobacterium MO_207.B10]|nr:ABC transporter permease DevC [Microcoleaceae cyanobacterium MO_207.B10]
MTRKIPLAWLQLTKEKVRLLVAMAGIGFADLLMFMQFGFRDALFDSAVKFHQKLEGDIFLVSSQSTALRAMKSFSQRRLYQVLAFESVASISPIYIDFGFWRNPESRDSRAIMVIGFNPADQVFNLPGVVKNQNKIKLSDVVLFDEASRDEYGAIAASFSQGKTVVTELENRRIKVGGLFNIGASFGADGNVITSDLNFLRIFNQRRSRGLIDIGVVKLKSGYESEVVVETIRNKLPNDVFIFSKSEFMRWEKTYWQESTAIGFVFTLGAGMGFIVGIVIVYQILYTDVSDHLPEYATLKAMGYADRYFLLVIFQQSLILAIIGYIPGFTVANILYGLARNATGLPMIMTISKAIMVWVLTMFMCCLSGVIAMRKLQEADPADIF